MSKVIDSRKNKWFCLLQNAVRIAAAANQVSSESHKKA
jgi:hypothetical protein